MKYAIDSNILITASNNTYPLDVFPSFWEKISSLLMSGDIIIIDKVYDEVIQGTDHLSNWLKNEKINKGPTGTVNVNTSLAFVSDISQGLVKSNFYSGQQTLDVFFRGADPYLIAFCKANGCVCVTEETINNMQPNQRKGFSRIKIPDIAAKVGVTCINTIEMLRRLKTLI